MKKKTAGYSGTPLIKKLGLKEGCSVIFLNEPSHYVKLLGGLPNGIQILTNYKKDSADFMHLFYSSVEELAKSVEKLKPCLKMDGLMWVSWPKGTSRIETDLNREIVRELVLKAGLVDIKVAAIDEDWSGLKFVYRKKDRKL